MGDLLAASTDDSADSRIEMALDSLFRRRLSVPELAGRVRALTGRFQLPRPIDFSLSTSDDRAIAIETTSLFSIVYGLKKVAVWPMYWCGVHLSQYSRSTEAILSQILHHAAIANAFALSLMRHYFSTCKKLMHRSPEPLPFRNVSSPSGGLGRSLGPLNRSLGTEKVRQKRQSRTFPNSRYPTQDPIQVRSEKFRSEWINPQSTEMPDDLLAILNNEKIWEGWSETKETIARVCSTFRESERFPRPISSKKIGILLGIDPKIVWIHWNPFQRNGFVDYQNG
jgi:hypothetical protein